MKVFEEISDVIPSDAHQMARSSLLHRENCGISDNIGQKSCFSAQSQVFLSLESANPLQAFCTSTALLVRCSVSSLDHYSSRNIHKTIKNKENQSKNDTK